VVWVVGVVVCGLDFNLSLCLHGCPFSPFVAAIFSFAVRPRPTGRT
jgi:hypothetical protein